MISPISTLFTLCVIICVGGGKEYRRRRLTAEEQLIMDLFRGYDTDARAVVNTTSTVTVSIQFLLLRIQRLVRTLSLLQTCVQNLSLIAFFFCYHLNIRSKK